MRKSCALLLLVLFSWLGGLGQDARAGVTVDVLFQDGTGSALTIPEGDVGPGCSFGGYLSGSVSTGRCMDVILTSTYEMVRLSTSVSYDSDNGLAVGSMYEWTGFTSNRSGAVVCDPSGGPTDNGGEINSFDCVLPPPNNPPLMYAGTYRIGTIIWDTSGTTVGTEAIAAYINDLFDGVDVAIDGNIVPLLSADIVVGSAVLTIIPEPSTAALLGLGFMGLVLTERRRRLPTR